MDVQIQILNKFKGIGFLSAKAGSFSGVPQRTVQLWTERGLLAPDISDTSGYGKRRKYSALNCLEIGLIKALSDFRLPHKLIKGAMRFLRENERLLRLIREENGYLILRAGHGDTHAGPVYHSYGWSEKDSDRFDVIKKRWIMATQPVQYDAVIVIDIKRIVGRVLSAMS